MVISLTIQQITLSLKLITRKSFCTNSASSSVSENSRLVADSLISIFTKRPFSSSLTPALCEQQLKDLGSMLNTHIVETVLKGFKSWRVAHEFFFWASNQPGYAHNCYTYNAMASILSHARQNASLRYLASQLVNSRCYMPPGALGFFIRCLGSQGLVKEANMLFDEVKRFSLCNPNIYTYTCLLEAISKSSDVLLMESRLNEMKSFNFVLDKYALTPVLSCYCNAGEFEKALEIFNRMYEKGWVDSYVFSILVVSLSKWGEVDKAFELIKKMENQKNFGGLNEKTYCILIHGFVKEGTVERALQLLNKMRSLGCNADISIYDVLIDGLCRDRQFEKALQLCWEMNELGIFPDIKILTNLVSCMPEDEDMIRLLETRQEVLNEEARILLFNSVLKGLVDKNSVDKAYKLLRTALAGDLNDDNEMAKIIGSGELVLPDTTSFETVVSGLCKADRLDMALELFRDMDRIGCKRSLLLYNNMIDCLSNYDRLKDCFTLLGEMKESGFQPTNFTHNSIFGCLCKREDVSGACSMLREMRTNGHDPWIKYYTLLVKKLCKHGRAIEACDFLSNMVQEGFLPDVIAYSAAVDGLFLIGESERALLLFRDLCSRGYCPDVVAYNIVLKGLCKVKRLEESNDLLDEMLNKGLVPSVVTYNILIDGWCKFGDIDKGIQCLSRMLGEERVPNVITYTTLIDGCCNSGRPDEAEKLWGEMKENGCFPNRIAYMALINGLCKCGKLDEAILYLEEMEGKNMTPDPFIYVALIDTSISNSNPIVACNLLKKMAQRQIYLDPNDKNHVILQDAILLLSKDSRTSFDTRNLMAEGSIPSYIGGTKADGIIE